MTQAIDTLFRNARLPDGRLATIAVAQGKIARIGADAERDVAVGAGVDLGGRLVVPGFVEGHIHLDTSFYGDVWRPHADDVETLESRILPVDQTIWNDVAAHTANAADHHLRTDAGELMHRGQPTQENEVTDLAMPAERRRRREDNVVTDLAIVADMRHAPLFIPVSGRTPAT